MQRKAAFFKIAVVEGGNADYAMYVGYGSESNAEVMSGGMKLIEQQAEPLKRVLESSGMLRGFADLRYRP